MEKSLEALNKRLEEDWLDKLEDDIQGRLIIGMKFIKYKETVTSLREVVERHFNTVMREIMNGLPSIACADDSETDYTFDGTNTGTLWTCRICQVKNPIAAAKCSTC